MFCWVLGLLVSPTVSQLAPGVSAGQGVVAFGLGAFGVGVGAGAGLGVAVTGPGCGFGRGSLLGVAGRGRSPLLAEGLSRLPLCPSGVSRRPCRSAGGRLHGSCSSGFRVSCAFVVRAVLALWCVVCVCGACVAGGCGNVCCVRPRACVRCVGGAFGCLSSPFWAWFCGSVWVRGLCVVAPLPPWLWGPGAVPRCPLLGSVGGGVSPRPFACPPPSFSLPRRLGRCSPGALPGPTRLW